MDGMVMCGNRVHYINFLTFKSSQNEIMWLKHSFRYRLMVPANYKNEKEVGQALTEAFQQVLVKREDIFVTTKVHWIIY